jgi:hypothetical protein
MTTLRTSIRAAAALLGLFVATSCGSPRATVNLQVTPSTSAVFVNGRSVGEGSKPIPLEFTEGNRRVFVQVVAEGYLPFNSHYTWEMVREMARSGRGLPVTLREY